MRLSVRVWRKKSFRVAKKKSVRVAKKNQFVWPKKTFFFRPKSVLIFDKLSTPMPAPALAAANPSMAPPDGHRLEAQAHPNAGTGPDAALSSPDAALSASVQPEQPRSEFHEKQITDSMWRPELPSALELRPSFSSRPCSEFRSDRDDMPESDAAAVERLPARMVRMGETYQGAWREGLRHGRGTWRSITPAGDGAQYKGEWREDMFDGEGTYAWGGSDRIGVGGGVRQGRSTGDSFEGEWRAGLQHGHGVLCSQAHGDRYEGMWRAGKQHGLGTYTWPDGAEYQGAFHEGVISGQGVFCSGAKHCFTGSFACSRPTEGIIQETHSKDRFFCTFAPACDEIWFEPTPISQVRLYRQPTRPLLPLLSLFSEAHVSCSLLFYIYICTFISLVYT